MATARQQIKSWFETGDFPTQSQFYAWIDSFFHSDEDTIPMAKVTGLDEALANIQSPAQTTTREFKVARHLNISEGFTFQHAGTDMLTGFDIRFVSGAPVVKVGTTNGGEELISERNIVTGEDENIPLPKSFPTTRTIYVGVSGGVVSIIRNYETNYYQ